MNVVFVAPRSWPAVGGMESFLRDLTRALADRGHLVSVLAQGLDSGPRGRLADSLRPPPTFEPFADGDVRVEPLRLPAATRTLLAPLVVQVTPVLRRYAYGRPRVAAARLYAHVAGPVIAARARGADVIHMWGGDLLGAAALHAARLLGVPFAITPFAHEGRWGDDRACALTYRSADRLIALLRSEASLYERLGVAPDRVAVCGVGSPGVRAGGAAELRARHRIDGPLVLFLGVRRPYKGFDLMLEAAPLVAARRPDVTFAFAGPGRPLPPVAGVRVVDAGEVDAQEKAAWLEAADLLCLPSESEIFPSSFLEAWSVGTPVLTSDIPPLAELIAMTNGGWIVARKRAVLADAVVAALADPPNLRARGAAGEAFWRSHCTPQALAAVHEDIYRRLVGRVAVEVA